VDDVDVESKVLSPNPELELEAQFVTDSCLSQIGFRFQRHANHFL
jgi:hypothetical protein